MVYLISSTGTKNMRNDTAELLIRLLFRKITGKAGWALIVTGLLIISPPLWIDVINLVINNWDLGPIPIPKTTPNPAWALVLIFPGSGLVALNHIWVPKQSTREIIGIRHNSLSHFPRSGVQRDLPLIQRFYHYREIDIDHGDAYEGGILSDHESILRRLHKVPYELLGLLKTAPNTPIAYYGLAHVPLAFYLGYLLSDNKYNIKVYELNNTSNRWNQLSELFHPIETTCNALQFPINTNSGDIVLSIGLSYLVHQTDIDALKLPNLLGHIMLKARSPQRQLLQSHTQVEQLASEFRQTLESIKNTFPNCQRIHLFYAGPVSLCFALGRCISERIDPEILIYNYSSKEQPKYAWSLSINCQDNSAAKFTRYSPKGEENDTVQHA